MYDLYFASDLFHYNFNCFLSSNKMAILIFTQTDHIIVIIYLLYLSHVNRTYSSEKKIKYLIGKKHGKRPELIVKKKQPLVIIK